MPALSRQHGHIRGDAAQRLIYRPAGRAATIDSMARNLYLIDGHAQIYRCYYGPFGSLTAPGGEPTKAVYGFVQMLLSLVKNKKPDYLAMVLDSGEAEVFRVQISADYKAHRAPMPEDLPGQIKRIVQILAEAGVPILVLPGYEADDILATFVERLKSSDVRIYLVSKDKDLDQLLSDKVFLYDPSKDAVWGPRELLAEKGYPPEKAVEVQSLSGDSVDNIEGIPGVGPKTAAKLIMKYGTADEVVRHADEQTPKLKENLIQYGDRIKTTRQLVTLHREVPLEVDLEKLAFRGLRRDRIEPLFRELGFERLLRQLETVPPPAMPTGLFDDEAAPPGPAVERAAGQPSQAQSGAAVAPIGDLFSHTEVKRSVGQYQLIDTTEKFEGFLALLTQERVFSVDTETTSLTPVDADLVGMSFSWKAGQGYYIPIRATGGQVLPERMVLDRLRPILESPDVAKVGQNLKYDMIVLRQAGVHLKGAAFDTMIASFLADPDRLSHGMDRLALELLSYQTIPITDLIGKGRKQIRMDQVPTARVCEYAAEDADVAWRLREKLQPLLQKNGLMQLFEEVEMPLVEVLAAMECRGVKLDTAVLGQMGAELDKRIEDLRVEIQQQAGHAFNIDSTRQLAEVLFDEQHLPVVRKTKTGRSTDAAVLVDLAAGSDNAIPKLVLEYRELGKLKGTYVDTLPTMISQRTGRIHTSFNQIGAVTGRLSSSDPNLQNIPMRTELGRQIRRAFVPGEPGWVLMAGDYSQIELRILAHFTQDPGLLAAFREDRDIHAFVASQIFDVPLDAVTSQQRSRAKTVNFGIIYGQGAHGLAQQTGMSNADAKDFIAKYFHRYPGIRRFIDECIRFAEQNGYVQTLMGRRRPITEIRSRNPGLRAQAERFAINSVIQGTAADMMKKAMVQIHRRLETDPTIHMLIQVHDELVFEVPADVVEDHSRMVRDEMAAALPLDVPIKVDISWGSNWLEAK
jgi:DNA polymerase I